MMARRRHDPITYVVVWPAERIVKVGWTSYSDGYQRWRIFVNRGAIVSHLYRDARGIGIDLESEMHRELDALLEPAFAEKDEARPYLGANGCGWMECYRVPRAMLEHVLEHVLPGIAKRLGASNATVRDGTERDGTENLPESVVQLTTYSPNQCKLCNLSQLSSAHERAIVAKGTR